MSDSWKISRRGFLIGAGAVGGAALTGGAVWGLAGNDGRPRAAAAPSAKGASPSSTAAAGGTGPLVIVTMYGGNDGLNTVIPYTDSAYVTARPTLGYTPEQVLDLEDGLGLNPQLTGFQSLWKSGQLVIVRGVGYPNPNLSHFASMDIWQTANPVDGTGVGWLGRWLDATGDDPMRAISVGASLPPMLRGESESATAIVSPRIELAGSQGFQQAFAALQKRGSDRTGLAAAIATTGSDLLQVQGRLDALSTSTATSDATTTVSESDIDGQLGIVADLINAGAPTKVYQVSLSSFDTHADERADQERLLAELDAAVTKFLAAIAQTAAGRSTVMMTFSEFGRRPLENASGGTDHGAAAPLFVIGHSVKGGQFYGEEPSLTSLDANGNVIYNVDFRSVYATVLENVVGFDSKDVLGGTFPTLSFV